MISATLLDLTQHLNAVSATADSSRHLGAANAWGNSFPAEELPFGKVVFVASVPFRMPSRGGAADNMEALGQIVNLPKLSPIAGLALLCYGEMGEQGLTICAQGIDGRVRRLSAIAQGWPVEKNAAVGHCGFECSHLHYNDGCEFSALRPVLWCWKSTWEDPLCLKHLMLGTNPLFHISAVTCLHA